MLYSQIKEFDRAFRYTSPAYKNSRRRAECRCCSLPIEYEDYFFMCNWDTDDKSEPIHARCIKHWFPEGYWYIGRGLASKVTPELRTILETPFELSPEAEDWIQFRREARRMGWYRRSSADFRLRANTIRKI